jgi:hypothetical protein
MALKRIPENKYDLSMRNKSNKDIFLEDLTILYVKLIYFSI